MCLTGDGVQAGDQPGAKPVFDSIPCRCLRLAASCVTMASSCLGRKLTTPPQLFLGAAVNPFAPPFDFRRSISARRSPPARNSCRRSTVSTCPCSEPSMQKARDLGHTEKVFVPVRRRPLASAKTAKWIRTTCLASTSRTHHQAAEGAQDQKKEGKQLCIDIITR